MSYFWINQLEFCKMCIFVYIVFMKYEYLDVFYQKLILGFVMVVIEIIILFQFFVQQNDVFINIFMYIYVLCSGFGIIMMDK